MHLVHAQLLRRSCLHLGTARLSAQCMQIRIMGCIAQQELQSA